jgi:hypothetical protein
MSIEFKTRAVQFDPTQGQRQYLEDSVHFAGRVHRAEAAIKGFSLGYTNNDHHIWREQITVDKVDIQDNVVRFGVSILIRDSSGDIDDPFDGSVEVLVIADVAQPVLQTRAARRAFIERQAAAVG